jgi:hypothetical protein
MRRRAGDRSGVLGWLGNGSLLPLSRLRHDANDEGE